MLRNRDVEALFIASSRLSSGSSAATRRGRSWIEETPAPSRDKTRFCEQPRTAALL
jgi:hypothetical protein